MASFFKKNGLGYIFSERIRFKIQYRLAIHSQLDEIQRKNRELIIAVSRSFPNPFGQTGMTSAIEPWRIQCRAQILFLYHSPSQSKISRIKASKPDFPRNR